MKKLFYVRHGETDMNISKTLSGQIETQLTENGRHQAKLGGQSIKDGSIRIDHVLCSPLQRTKDTAAIIAAEIGFPVEKIEYNELFLERSFGTLEGTAAADFIKSPGDYKKIDEVEGAETVEELQKRAAKALDYVKTLPDDNILVVSHGAFGRAFRRVVQNLPHTHEYEGIQWIGNAEIIELI